MEQSFKSTLIQQ